MAEKYGQLDSAGIVDNAKSQKRPEVSIAKKIAFGVGASWFSRALNIVLGLFLIPVLFQNLDKEELGVWMLLGQTWLLVGILDLGFTPTISRRIALARGKSSPELGDALDERAAAEIADIMATGRRLYLLLSSGAFLLSFLAGTLFLTRMELSTLPHWVACVAWAILCLSQAFGVWASLWVSMLQGVGYIGWESIFTSIVGVGTIVCQILAVWAGGGLVALAAIAAIGALAQRFLIIRFAQRKRPELFAAQGRYNKGVLVSMWSPAFRCWLTTLGITLVVSTDQFFIAGMLGVKELPSYRAAFLLFFNVNALATTAALASVPFVSHLWQRGESIAIRNLLFNNLHLGLGIMAATGACLLALDETVFNLWLGQGNFVGTACVWVFFLLFILNAQALVMSSCSRATEDEAFAISSVVSGVLKLIFAYILSRKYGLIGVALSSLLAQGVTNHWYMVYKALKRFSIPFAEYSRRILAPITLLFGLVFGALWILRVLGGGLTPFALMAVGSAISMMLLCAYLWTFALAQKQKERILALFSRK